MATRKKGKGRKKGKSRKKGGFPKGYGKKASYKRMRRRTGKAAYFPTPEVRRRLIRQKNAIEKRLEAKKR